MTIATFLLIILGQRVTLTQRLLMRENLMLDQFGNLVRLTVAIVLVATGIQLCGFIVLFTYFFLFAYPLGEAIWQAAFQCSFGVQQRRLHSVQPSGRADRLPGRQIRRRNAWSAYIHGRHQLSGRHRPYQGEAILQVGAQHQAGAYGNRDTAVHRLCRYLRAGIQ